MKCLKVGMLKEGEPLLHLTVIVGFHISYFLLSIFLCDITCEIYPLKQLQLIGQKKISLCRIYYSYDIIQCLWF